jgi:hypothetical protein
MCFFLNGTTRTKKNENHMREMARTTLTVERDTNQLAKWGENELPL